MMINDIFATKLGMTQAWTKDGKRLAVTRCKLSDNLVVGKKTIEVLDKNSQKRQTVPCIILEVGYGQKKLKNMSKPLRTRLEKSGFNFGVSQIRGIRMSGTEENSETVKVGDTIKADSILSVGDMVQVQGLTRGKGFTGAMKRHGFAGGPKTHGQSDRARAVGSIGAGTSPGRVWPGKKMPGRSGNITSTVRGLVVVHLDPEQGEIWLSGPIPGVINTNVKISKMGKSKNVVLDKKASGIKEVKAEVAPKVAEPEEEVVEAPVAESPAEPEVTTEE